MDDALVVRDAERVVDVEELSEFLLIAAILLEMKSQRLLPGRDSTEPDEEFLGWEERDVLLARLLELRTYAALSDALESLFERAARALPRLRGVDDGLVVDPPDLLAGVSVARVADCAPAVVATVVMVRAADAISEAAMV